MNPKALKIIAVVTGVALAGYVGYRIYKYQQLKVSNKQKDDRKIKIITTT